MASLQSRIFKEIGEVNSHFELFRGVQTKLFEEIDARLIENRKFLEELQAFQYRYETFVQVGTLAYLHSRLSQLKKVPELGTNLRYEYLQFVTQYHLKDIFDLKIPIKKKFTLISAQIAEVMTNLFKSLDQKHWPISQITHGNMIYSVTCKCGEVTEYRLPLKTLDDFECPKRDRKGK